MKVVLRKRALDDLKSAYAFLAEEGQDVAEDFLKAIDEEFELLGAHPFLGRKRHFKRVGLRSWRVRRFEKFLIFYRPTDRNVEIVRVLHGARDIARLIR